MFAARAAAHAVRTELDDGIPSMAGHSDDDLMAIRASLVRLAKALEALSVGTAPSTRPHRESLAARDPVALLVVQMLTVPVADDPSTPKPTGGADEEA